jgi:hypothetical protein
VGIIEHLQDENLRLTKIIQDLVCKQTITIERNVENENLIPIRGRRSFTEVRSELEAESLRLKQEVASGQETRHARVR